MEQNNSGKNTQFVSRADVNRFVILLTVVIGMVSTYYIGMNKQDKRITVLETKVGDHNLETIVNTIEFIQEDIKNVEETTNKIYTTVGDVERALSAYTGKTPQSSSN